ncbi:glycosyltransferase family 9 protein [Candidatus Nitrospira bockiana]
MKRRVLIANITRMGDLIQTIPLLHRLRWEWPEVEVELVVDRAFVQAAALLPGIRAVHAYDFQGLIDQARTMAKDVVTLYRDLSAWVRPLQAARYDRVINLTFNRRSGLLAALIGAPDTRGVTATRDGASIVRNPWLAYFADLQCYRRFNRFNLVDLYALGGSGPGPYVPLRLAARDEDVESACRLLRASSDARTWIGVQVGASEAIKAWRPELYGRTMASLARRTDAAFVVIGTAGEAAAVREAIRAYRAAGGRAPLCDAVGRTTLGQLLALLAQVRLLLTNDTGPMHLGVGAGTAVIDLSVGHVDFHETGPYGWGHWVVQPTLECAPCGFDRVCPHHACKDRVDPEDVAALCLHVLGQADCPEVWTGAAVYQSVVDEDGLTSYTLRAGTPSQPDWYGAFWRRFWYESFAGASAVAGPATPAPDRDRQLHLYERVTPIAGALVRAAESLAALCRRRPLPVARIQSAQAGLLELREEAVAMTRDSAAFGPVTVSLLRELYNGDSSELADMASQQAQAYRAWARRLASVAARVGPVSQDRQAGRATILPMAAW